MQEIHPLTLANRALINEYLVRHPPNISELTFTNLFVWRHARPVYYALANDSLLFLIKTAEDSKRYLLFGKPVGPLTTAEALKEFASILVGAIRIPEDETHLPLQAGYTILKDRANYDYIYRVSDLAVLAGRRYAKKRNLIKQCLQGQRCTYEEITEKNLADCLAMQNSWCRLRNCGHSPGLCNENTAIEEIFRNYLSLDTLIGGAIRIDGRIQAYAIGEQLLPGTAVWHFEKAMPAITGLGQLINQWFSKYGLERFDFVNREQDLGVPGLRQAKESYYPHHLVTKHTIFLGEPFQQQHAAEGRCGVEN
jgi:hypothetical protein